jgi:hypothetical protein
MRGSSYKQMSRFLKAMTKRGWITTKPQKSDIVVTSVDREHVDYKKLVVTKVYHHRTIMNKHIHIRIVSSFHTVK